MLNRLTIYLFSPIAFILGTIFILGCEAVPAGDSGVKPGPQFLLEESSIDCRKANTVCPGDESSDLEAQFINESIEIIGSNVRTLHLKPGTWKIDVDISLPGNIALEIANGAKLAIDENVTLTIGGGLLVGSHQHVFSGPGIVLFANGNQKSVYPQWFGAKGDDGKDDTAAFQAAIDSVYESSHLPLTVPSGNYLISSVSRSILNYHSFKIIGAGRGLPPGAPTSFTKHGDSSKPMFNFFNEVGPLQHWKGVLKDFTIIGKDNAHDGIHLTGLAYFSITDVSFYNCDRAIQSAGSLVYSIRNSNFHSNKTAIHIRKHPTEAVFANAITIEKSVFGSNSEYAIDFDTGNSLSLINLDIENNGTAGVADSGGVIIGEDVGGEGSHSSVNIDRSWFEGNNGWAIRSKPPVEGKVALLSLNIQNTKSIASELGQDVFAEEAYRFSFLNSEAPTARAGQQGTVVVDAGASVIVNSTISLLTDTSSRKTHLNVFKFGRHPQALFGGSGITLDPIAVGQAFNNTLFVDEDEPNKLKWLTASGVVKVVKFE
jgi:hypothetical protein